MSMHELYMHVRMHDNPKLKPVQLNYTHMIGIMRGSLCTRRLTLFVLSVIALSLVQSGLSDIVPVTITVDSSHALMDILCGGDGSSNLTNNTNLLLSAQMYTIAPEGSCLIDNVHDLTIRGNSTNLPSVIQCLPGSNGNSSSGLVFTNAYRPTLANVVIKDCGVIMDMGVLDLDNSSLFHFNPGEAAALVYRDCYNISLLDVKIVNYSGRALIAIDVFDHSVLDTVVISDDSVAVHNICHLDSKSKNTCKGSGMVWMYTNTGKASANTTVDVINSTFANNTGYLEISYNRSFVCGDLLANSLYSTNVGSLRPINIPSAGAMTFLFQQHSFVQANIIDSDFLNNRGMCYGAILAIYLSEAENNSLSFSGCSFSNNTQFLSNFSYQSGRYFGSTITLLVKYLGNYTVGGNCFSIVDSDFITGDEASATAQLSLTQFPASRGLCESMFRNLTGDSSRFINAVAIDLSDSFHINMSDIYLIGGEIYDQPILGIGDGLLAFSYIMKVSIRGSKDVGSLFTRLTGPVIYAEVSNVIFTGKIDFSNNIASTWTSGAAIFLRGESKIWFQEPLNLTFRNNSALEGGAIYSVSRFAEYCTFQFMSKNSKVYNESNIGEIAINVTFIHNKARSAGNSIYVSPLYHCSTRLSPIIQVDPHIVYDTIFHFVDNYTNGLLEISSRPLRVCICGGDPTNTSREALHCDQAPNIISTYPGKTFNLSVVPVDQSYKRVYSLVYNNLHVPEPDLDESDFDWHLGYSEDIVQLQGYNCTTMTYTVFSGKPARKGMLSVYPSGSTTGLFVNISLNNCPPGFEIVKESGLCDCVEVLMSKGVQCSISNGTVTRPGTSWIGIVESNLNGTVADYNLTNSSMPDVIVGYSEHCPTRYCNETASTVNVSDTSSLCIYERTGVLCGRCKPGLSITVGSPVCLQCSNWWLLTIPLYALLGVAIVFLLLILQLTVTQGTINGLIFYATLLNVDTYTLLTGYKGAEWSVIILSFLNFELGFPVCLYDGLNEINKALLSIVFPIYILLLAIAFVYVSRYSYRFASWTSRSAIPVLATLIYITYYKLLRFSVNGLTYGVIQLQYPPGQSQKVWYYDGSIHYLHDWKHLLLFFMVLVVICVFILPYGVLLTGIRFFNRFRIINKFKPLIDAYCAPYKDRYRFWFGARLWVLVVTYVLFAILRDFPLIFVLCQCTILLLFTLAQVAIMPFRSKIINWLDLFFMVNALLLMIVVLYSYSRTSNEASAVSVALTVVVFCCIVGYHAWKRLQVMYIYCKRLRRSYRILEDDGPRENTVTRSSFVITSANGDNGQNQHDQHNPPNNIIPPSEFRDSILDDSVADNESDTD